MKIIFSFLILINTAFTQQKNEWNEVCLMDIGPRMCNATATMDHPSWRTFSPTNLFDHDLETIWAVKGGTGIKIYAILDEGTSSLKIANGWQKIKLLFQQNNRVKKVSVSIMAGFSFQGYVNEIGRIYQAVVISKAKDISIKDVMGMQTLIFPFDWKDLAAKKEKAVLDFPSKLKVMDPSVQAGYGSKKIQSYIICIEIKEYYPGKSNVTCISEISFLK